MDGGVVVAYPPDVGLVVCRIRPHTRDHGRERGVPVGERGAAFLLAEAAADRSPSASTPRPMTQDPGRRHRHPGGPASGQFPTGGAPAGRLEVTATQGAVQEAARAEQGLSGQHPGHVRRAVGLGEQEWGDDLHVDLSPSRQTADHVEHLLEELGAPSGRPIRRRGPRLTEAQFVDDGLVRVHVVKDPA